ncbi:MAG: PEP-CTERM sorting domain-containing protein [Planctomycetia bacterium]|nr:PEP-CTERM sorting domain-containing protein [Planctomycetia bacterium]
MKRRFWLGGSAALLLSSVGSVQADWLIQTYSKPSTGVITNYATADALIGGAGLAFSNAAQYSLANTQDNGDGGGPFGLGTQVVGIGPGDINDFAFVGTGSLSVATTGSYQFFTNTDDGSRLRLNINGGGFNQVIADDVLSGPHTVPSAAIPLTAGDSVAFDWMWFEAGGGAEGEFFYDRDGGADALIGDGAQGLTLDGGAFTGTVYKSLIVPGITINNFADATTVVNTPGTFKGQGYFPTFNISNSDSDGVFPGGVNVVGVAPGADDFVAIGTGFLDIQPGMTGDYIFRSNTDDGGRLKIDLNDDGDFDDAGELVINRDVLQGATDTDSLTVNFASDGYYMIEYSFFERGGGAEGELSARSVNSASFVLVGDTANGGLGVVRPVPEPSTLILAGLGGLAALLYKRRK